MIKMQKIHIKRYRSILDLTINVNTNNNFITICGENNTGKTNTLRAMDLFFNPEKYEPSKDVPHHKLEGSRGGAVCPDISIEFLLPDGDVYRIRKEFNLESLNKVEGKKLKLQGKRDKVEELIDKEIKDFLKVINFFFIEAINISFPKLINELIDEVYDIEYAQSRFRGLKSDLKESFEKYTEGVLDILEKLAEEINPIFREYKENWGIGFELETDVKKFRDLISDEITFYIRDSSNKHIEGKGSGLQRLGYILLHSRIIEKIKSKSIFLLIDEPDVYLHQGLQKKLLNQLRGLTASSQIFITTHSPIFIDSYTLENVFLLDLEISDKEYTRKHKSYNALSTEIVDLEQISGAKKIRDYLGIEELDYELLDRYNIIVEGDTDKFYIEELSKFFKLTPPNIISVSGADNVPQYLKFYDGFYNGRNTKPCVLVLLDNDSKGREVFKQVKSLETKIGALDIKVKFVPNFLGESLDVEIFEKGRINTNHQIEDFLYPNLLCELVNRLLKKKDLDCISSTEVSKKINKQAFKYKGILDLVENAKNEKNPDDGQIINFTTSSQASEGIKKGLSALLKIQGDKKLIEIIQSENLKYPKVKEFLELITDSSKFIS